MHAETNAKGRGAYSAVSPRMATPYATFHTIQEGFLTLHRELVERCHGGQRPEISSSCVNGNSSVHIRGILKSREAGTCHEDGLQRATQVAERKSEHHHWEKGMGAGCHGKRQP